MKRFALFLLFLVLLAPCFAQRIDLNHPTLQAGKELWDLLNPEQQHIFLLGYVISTGVWSGILERATLETWPIVHERLSSPIFYSVEEILPLISRAYYQGSRRPLALLIVELTE